MVERLDLSWPAAEAENRWRGVPGSIQTRGRAIRFTLLLTLLLGHFAATAQAQVDPRTALLERAGWDAIASGQAHAAAEAFREALTADPKNGRLHLGAGMAAALERRDSDAKDAFERAIALDPKLVRARAPLGQVLYRMGDLNAAIRTRLQVVAIDVFAVLLVLPFLTL